MARATAKAATTKQAAASTTETTEKGKSFYGLGVLFDTSSENCPLVGSLDAEVLEALGIPEAAEGKVWKVFVKARTSKAGKAYWSMYLGQSDAAKRS